MKTIEERKKDKIHHCQRCKCEISEERFKKSIKDRWLPLCGECEPVMKKHFKKWHKKWEEFGLS